MNLILITCSMTKLRDLLGGQDAECSFALTLVERIFDCSAHVKFGKGCAFDLLMHVMNALSLNLSDETFSCCVSRVLKESEVQGGISKAHAVSCLLEPFARRAPERMMRWAIQTFAPPLKNVSTPLNELQWCAHLLAGCIRGAGLAGFSYRHELLHCIQCQVSFITREEQILAAAALLMHCLPPLRNLFARKRRQNLFLTRKLVIWHSVIQMNWFTTRNRMSLRRVCASVEAALCS
ncbi:hypothetical protein C3747_139g93 [Trypanosoma cruzi]|uniref:Uncharacterized protein n=1 Tax=Trypanosoma cruzi TaxID=5693 RepID=A0A2V2W8I5_TRYCR|nr:hypothetical protein C3747_139g93 [Trypanosoma cruzi]